MKILHVPNYGCLNHPEREEDEFFICYVTNPVYLHNVEWASSRIGECFANHEGENIYPLFAAKTEILKSFSGFPEDWVVINLDTVFQMYPLLMHPEVKLAS